jgi:hypothetical protein
LCGGPSLSVPCQTAVAMRFIGEPPGVRCVSGNSYLGALEHTLFRPRFQTPSGNADGETLFRTDNLSQVLQLSRLARAHRRRHELAQARARETKFRRHAFPNGVGNEGTIMVIKRVPNGTNWSRKLRKMPADRR